jgi:hypothetical protein
MILIVRLSMAFDKARWRRERREFWLHQHCYCIEESRRFSIHEDANMDLAEIWQTMANQALERAAEFEGEE